jgi:hypothetical protein
VGCEWSPFLPRSSSGSCTTAVFPDATGDNCGRCRAVGGVAYSFDAFGHTGCAPGTNPACGREGGGVAHLPRALEDNIIVSDLICSLQAVVNPNNRDGDGFINA